MHEDGHFLAWLHQHGGQEIGDFLQVRILTLAKINREDASEGSIVAQSLEINELDQDVGVVGGLNLMLKLLLHHLYLIFDNSLLLLFSFGFPDGFD